MGAYIHLATGVCSLGVELFFQLPKHPVGHKEAIQKRRARALGIQSPVIKPRDMVARVVVLAGPPIKPANAHLREYRYLRYDSTKRIEV